MIKDVEKLFEPLILKNISLKNRIIRSATYEGYGRHGVPDLELANVYSALADGGVGAIITGFVYISQAGMAMQLHQCGIDDEGKTNAWKAIVVTFKEIHQDVKLFMQISHAGRQTLSEVTGQPVYGVSEKKCSYFRQSVEVLTETQINEIICEYANAAYRAQRAGFDGVQIHAAHGYLVHQFLSAWTNTRTDRWGDKTLFLEKIIAAVQARCGEKFPILVKLSAGEVNRPGIQMDDTVKAVRVIESMGVNAIEISYGSMEHVFNIIRGDWPIDEAFNINPIFKKIPKIMRWAWKKIFLSSYLRKLISFENNYNVEVAAKIKSAINIPIIPVGGIRKLGDMLNIINDKHLDAISLCRPLICEPDFPNKIRFYNQQYSHCINCNLCTVYCDSDNYLKCYIGGKKNE